MNVTYSKLNKTVWALAGVLSVMVAFQNCAPALNHLDGGLSSGIDSLPQNFAAPQFINQTLQVTQLQPPFSCPAGLTCAEVMPEPVQPSKAYSLHFSPEGRLTGTSSCNGFFADYELKPAAGLNSYQVHLKNFVQTNSSCDDALNENLFMTVASHAAFITIDRAVIELSSQLSQTASGGSMRLSALTAK
jgi:heat shock protein HslJ